MPHTDNAGFISAVSDDLRVKTHASVLMLMQSCEEMAAPHACLQQAPIAAIRERVADITKRLDTLSADEQAALCSSLVADRDVVVDMLRNLKVLKSYANIAEALTLRDFCAIYTTETQAPNDGNALFNLHVSSLVTQPANNKQSATADTRMMSAFMALIPLRMTTAKYYDYVRDALHSADDELRKDNLDDYKRLFFPMMYLQGAYDFPEIKHPLDAAWNTEPAEDAEARKAAWEQVRQAHRLLIETATHINTLFDAVSAAYIVLRYTNEYGDPWNDAEIRTLFDQYKNIVNSSIDNGERDAFAKRLDQAVHDKLSQVKYGPLDDAFMDVPGLDAHPETQRMLDDWANTHALFYETGMDFFTETSVKPENPDETPVAPEVLFEFMDSCVAGLSGNRKRFLRQHYLSYLPYPYDLNAYQQYFLDTFDTLDNGGRALLHLYVTGMERV